MKIWNFILMFIFMMTSCSNGSNAQNLTWYNNATISNIADDPDKPEEFVRISIGISQQVFYLSKKSPEYKALIQKTTESFKNGKAYNIGIENKTNIIRQVNDIK